MTKGKGKQKALIPALPTDISHLSEAGQKLLNVLVDPIARTWTVTRICEAAGISRDSYYRLWKNSDFIQKYNETCQVLCLSHSAAIINALAESAKLNDTPAAKLMLEMANIYKPAANLNVTNNHDAGPNLLKMYLERRKQNELKGSAE